MPTRILTVLTFAAMLLASSPVLRAESNGEELLEMMRSDAGREVAQTFIDDVWQKWNEGLFCLPPGDRQQLSFDAVLSYLETHPELLFRPRRYLIVQGLRAAYPCSTG
ncbi:MAG: hypothetical protein JSU95_14125 [Betaproteobacteria bacterium]|nr:MAG: hypothetical protein JSU95_14125 [Betaproteobacteria bacterium]